MSEPTCQPEVTEYQPDKELVQRLTNIMYRTSEMTAQECYRLALGYAYKGMLNTAEMATLYNTSEEVIRQWARAKRIPGASKFGRDWMFNVCLLPDNLRVTNSGGGGLAPRLKKAIQNATTLSIREAAERYGVDPDTVRSLRKAQSEQVKTA